MRFVYNFLQVILLIPGLPLLVFLACRQKYRRQVWQRLGLGLRQKTERLSTPPGSCRIWLHCLSVGEVTSALPLIRGLRLEMPETRLIVSVTTTTGRRVAEKLLSPWADLVIAAPFDLLPVIRGFIDLLRPDLFILVETDFWPNWLYGLRERRVPAMLVNGRISAASFRRYQRLRRFFAPLFSTFSLLAMQTEHDAAQMRALQVEPDRIATLGNLKYAPPAASPEPAAVLSREALGLPAASEVWVCGSTHPGEEEIILAAFGALAADHPHLILLLAPRNPQRAEDIGRLARQQGMTTMRRSSPGDPPARILLLDTLGELAACYRFARLAFIGGSLVPCGGHNPLEPVLQGAPVLFGPHMEDFSEIARDLCQCGGAVEVHGADDLAAAVRNILGDHAVHAAMRAAAASLAAKQAGVIDRHLAAVARLLDARRH